MLKIWKFDPKLEEKSEDRAVGGLWGLELGQPNISLFSKKRIQLSPPLIRDSTETKTFVYY